MLRSLASKSLLSLAMLAAMAASHADEQSATATLEAAGFSVSGSKLVTESERELSNQLRATSKLRKDLLDATRELAGVQAKVDEFKAQLNGLTRQRVQLATQLANVRQGDVATNNKIVGAIQALDGQLELLKGKQPQADEAIAKARGGWNKAREAYLSEVLELRTLADNATAIYDEAAENKELQAAVEELNKSTGKEFSLEAPRTLASSIRKLEKIEDDVLTESITLRRQGNTLFANVVVNGKYEKEMVVDSGASILSLPAKVAQELGIEPTADDPPVQLMMADGRTIEGRLVTIDEVRVGQFTVQNVEAAVLGPDAVGAEPLLGMSFLGNFKFELDAKAGTLNMVNIEGANPADEKPARGRNR
ncbi:retropepsin-like aspartic protease [Aeoliella mucimassa]|uniref:Retroviral aspartyl protease n=1 Tax=Aeoliella mucimassa TaxID=2527972 RepID=A0A518AV51_9BACT|nr:retropepsin-like aspartic protease [Aeoliella mucimassa]QDU58604.1 hypothetical protein Pan181_48430 [Aeoliella mucimassa]